MPLKRELFTALRRVWSPPPSVYEHLHFQGDFETSVAGHPFKMRHYGFEVENDVFWSGIGGNWERVSLGLWTKLCADATYIFDIGANTGIYSLMASALRPSAHVYAFEPVSRVYRRLRENVDLNGYGVRTFPVALSNTDGEATIYDLPTEHIYSVTVNKNLHPPGHGIAMKIPVRRLDGIVREENIPRIDLMKIDVETHEPEVLEGMGELLARDRPTLLIEILDDEVGARVEALVDGLGYRFYNIDERTTYRRAAHLGKSDVHNFLVCSEETARKIGIRD
jgi:FkbM family methyltransferase